MAIWVELTDSDDESIEVRVGTPQGMVVIMADVRLIDGAPIFDDVHIDGPGPASLGIRLLYEIAQAVMEQLDVECLVVNGWRRETGARPGHWPRSFRFTRSRGDDRPDAAAAQQGAADPGHP